MGSGLPKPCGLLLMLLDRKLQDLVCNLLGFNPVFLCHSSFLEWECSLFAVFNGSIVFFFRASQLKLDFWYGLLNNVGCFACMYFCTPSVYPVSMEARGGHPIPWNWSYRWLGANHVSAGNQNWLLWKSSQWFWLPGNLSSSLKNFGNVKIWGTLGIGLNAACIMKYPWAFGD